MRRLAVVLVLGWAASCGDDVVNLDGSVWSVDAMGEDLGVVTDGGGPIGGAFTVAGCPKLDASSVTLQCTGPAPLRLTFFPWTAVVTMFVWSSPVVEPASSRALTPSVLFARPGSYTVTLAAGGPAGTTTASGTVRVTAGGVGSACSDDG